MEPDDILAVVVSFNGHGKTVLTIEALLGHVGHVLVVDNASDSSSIALLKSIERHADVSIHFLQRNCGIGFALNHAIRIAQHQGYRWLLTMDQDSLIDSAMLEQFQAAVLRNPAWACLTPTLVFAGREGYRGRDAAVDYAITSGNLVRMDIFDKIGFYDETMFVDQLDFDFHFEFARWGSESTEWPTQPCFTSLGTPKRHIRSWEDFTRSIRR